MKLLHGYYFFYVFFSLLTAPCSLLFLSSCGPSAVISLPSLAGKQPRVIEVEPAADSEIDGDANISVKFSAPVDPLSITKDSFLVIEDYTAEQLKDGEIAGMDGAYEVMEDGRAAKFIPENGLKAGTTYGIVVTNFIYTPDRLSLNQTPGSKPTPFISKFMTKDDYVESAVVAVAENSGAAETFEVVDNVDTVDNQISGDVAETSVVEVVLNEIYYDAPDVDTNGDLFVELRGTPDGNIVGYKLVFVNGDNGEVTETVTLPAGAKLNSKGIYVIADAVTGDDTKTNVANSDHISNFDPQNGPDAVQLFDPKGKLLDAVCYGNVPIKTAKNGSSMCEGDPSPDSPSGASISRHLENFDTNNNASDFFISEKLTPGEL